MEARWDIRHGGSVFTSNEITLPGSLVGRTEHLVFSDKDDKFRRSRVHVAHVKDPLAVGNRKEQAERPLSGQNSKFPTNLRFWYDVPKHSLICRLIAPASLCTNHWVTIKGRRVYHWAKCTLSIKCPGEIVRYF